MWRTHIEKISEQTDALLHADVADDELLDALNELEETIGKLIEMKRAMWSRLLRLNRSRAVRLTREEGDT